MVFYILFISQSNKETIIVRNKLRDCGYDAFVETVSNKTEIRKYIHKKKWHSIVLDYDSISPNIIVPILESLQKESYDGIVSVLLSKECNFEQSSFRRFIDIGAVYFFFKENIGGLARLIKREIDKNISSSKQVETVYKDSKMGELSHYVNEITELNIFLNFITENTGEIIYRLDSEGRIIFISQSIQKYGYVAEDLIGMYMVDLLREEDKEKGAFVVNERRSGERKSQLFECRFYGCRKKIKGEQYFNLLISSEGIYHNSLKGRVFRGTQGIGTDITEYKMTKQKLELTNDFVQFTVSTVSELLNISYNNIAARINQILKKIGEFEKADRAYIFFNNLFFFSDKSIHNYEWKEAGIDSIRDTRPVKLNEMLWWQDNLQKYGIISIPDISKLPDKAQYAKETLSSLNINSIISIAIKYNDRIIGQIGIESSKRREGEWDRQFIALLSIIAKMVVSNIEAGKKEITLLEQVTIL